MFNELNLLEIQNSFKNIIFLKRLKKNICKKMFVETKEIVES